MLRRPVCSRRPRQQQQQRFNCSMTLAIGIDPLFVCSIYTYIFMYVCMYVCVSVSCPLLLPMPPIFSSPAVICGLLYYYYDCCCFFYCVMYAFKCGYDALLGAHIHTVVIQIHATYVTRRPHFSHAPLVGKSFASLQVAGTFACSHSNFINTNLCFCLHFRLFV